MSRVGLCCGGQEKVNEAGTLGEEPVSWKASGGPVRSAMFLLALDDLE